MSVNVGELWGHLLMLVLEQTLAESQWCPVCLRCGHYSQKRQLLLAILQ